MNNESMANQIDSQIDTTTLNSHWIKTEVDQL